MRSVSDRASFIDFEYCDFNYFTYDIADHFCEFGGIENPDFSLFPCKSFMVAWLKSYLKWWNEGVSGNNNNFELNSMTISDVKIEKFLIHIRICAAV